MRTGCDVATWTHQNAYRRKRYFESTLQRTVTAERSRTAANKDGLLRPQCWAEAPIGSGRRCGRPPAAGSNVCVRHGGGAPQTRRLATIRHNYLKAHAMVKSLGDAKTLDDVLLRTTKKDPREVLLQQVHEAAAMAAATREMVGVVDLEALQDPTNEGFGAAQETHKLFALWQERAARTAKMALDIGIDEAMVKLAELQAKAMVGALKSVLAAEILGLNTAQQKVAQSLLGQELRRLLPDISTAPTMTLVVDGEEMYYNPAMDQYTGNPGQVAKDNGDAYRTARRARLREEARIDRRVQQEDPSPPAYVAGSPSSGREAGDL